MRASLRALAKLGISASQYKAIFTQRPEDRSKRLNALYSLIRERVRTAIDERLSDYKVYAAIDYAFDLPVSQSYVPIVQHILSKRLNEDDTLRLLRAYGVDPYAIFTEIEDKNEKKYVFNPPVFYDVIVPIVKAYSTIRAAKLFVDRRRDPLLPFLPLKNSIEDRIQCEIIQDIVRLLTTWWGYEATLKEAISQAVKYGIAVVFPREEWYRERQVTLDDNGNAKTYVARQGLRYMTPHPTRIFWDQRHPLSTLNSDSGVEWVGCWDVWRWGDILNNRQFWNRRNIVTSRNWFDMPSARAYFDEVFPCTIVPPVPRPNVALSREENLLIYSPNTTRDATIIITTLYMRIVPADFDLGPYRYPVWHRFIIAGDDTVLFAEPCAYTPAWFIGYDYDPQASVQSSLSLEVLPFQDHIANIITNILLVAKQNLLTLVYYDKNAVSESAIRQLEHAGDAKYRRINFLSYDGAILPRLGTDITRALQVVDLPKNSIAELLNVMTAMLNMMERIMQMSAAEIGSTGPHYQSAEEIRTISMYANSRLQWIGTHIDHGIEAWKQQLYDAIIEHFDDDIMAQITDLGPEADQALEELGFKVLERAKRKLIVKGKGNAIRLQGFAQGKSEFDREKNISLATTLYQVVQVVSSRPEIFQAVGVETIIQLVEEAARLSGAPSTFKLLPENMGEEPESIRTWVQQFVAASQQMMAEQLAQTVIAPIGQRLQMQDQAIGQLAEAIGMLQQAIQDQKRIDEQTAIKLQKAMADIQIKAMKAAAETRLQEQKTAAEIQRMQQKHKAEMAMKLAQAANELTKRDLMIATAQAKAMQDQMAASAQEAAQQATTTPAANAETQLPTVAAREITVPTEPQQQTEVLSAEPPPLE